MVPEVIRPSAVDRRTGTALARLDGQGRLALAQIEQQANLQVARVQAIGYVGQQGMHAVTMLSELEGRLGTVSPLSVSRLQAIGDLTALAIAGVVADTARKAR